MASLATRKFLGGDARYIANPAVWNVLLQRFEYVSNRNRERVSFFCAGCSQNCETRVPPVHDCVRYCSRACLTKDKHLDIRGTARFNHQGNNSFETDKNVSTLVANAYEAEKMEEPQAKKTKLLTKGTHIMSA